VASHPTILHLLLTIDRVVVEDTFFCFAMEVLRSGTSTNVATSATCKCTSTRSTAFTLDWISTTLFLTLSIYVKCIYIYLYMYTVLPVVVESTGTQESGVRSTSIRYGYSTQYSSNSGLGSRVIYFRKLS
jgi:hypothetical protein